VSRVAVSLASFALLAWAAVKYATQWDAPSSLRCRVTNVGVPVIPEEAMVQVFATGLDAELIAAGRAQERISLAPDDYDVRVTLTGSHAHPTRWLRGVEVLRGQAAVVEADFAVGALRVDVAVGGSGPAADTVVVYVFTPGEKEEPLTAVAPREPAVVAAGRYDVRVVLTNDTQEKQVKWLRDVEVIAGRERTLHASFARGSLLVSAFNANRPLGGDAVALHVYRHGDAQQEVVDTGAAGVALGLPVGVYDVCAAFLESHDRPKRWIRGLEIRDDEIAKARVDFTSGHVRVDARLDGDLPLEPYQAYVYFYRTEDHAEPLAYVPAGEAALLQAGRYDVRTELFRSVDRPERWLRDLAVEAGKERHETAAFASGYLLVRVFEADGTELVGHNATVGIYPHNHREHALSVARPAERMLMSSGLYDLCVTDTRTAGREVWVSRVAILPGESTTRSVALDATAREGE